jgi:WD40 repeat protein
MTSLHTPTLRLSNSASPFHASPSPRSPTKPARCEKDEPGLHLKKVIGTTTTAVTAFDHLSAQRKFAFTAGAAAVLVTVDDDLRATQHFFRAGPATTAACNAVLGNGSGNTGRDGTAAWPLTPTPGESTRYRPTSTLKDNASPIGAAARDWSDSPGRTVSARDRIKAATSVALSPNGKWMAVGETGYKPRILIFSIRDASSETPACVLSEHTFGVHALSFSPDSRYLASLGTVNDGFLYVWTIEERTGMATLFASNKCTSIINHMAWVGRTIVTIGLRFIKVWRPDDDASDTRETTTRHTITPRQRDNNQLDFGRSILSPKHRVLAGKNALLGDMLNATFVTVTAISNFKALICADSGEICLLDDIEKVQSLHLIQQTGARITAARMDDYEMYHVSHEDGRGSSFLVPDLERRSSIKAGRSTSTSPSTASFFQTPSVVACANLGDVVVEITSARTIQLSKSGAGPEILRQLPAHQDAVVGVQPLRSLVLPDATFCTFSADGTVRFWNDEGDAVCEPLAMPVEHSPEMYGLLNETKAVTTLINGTYIASGDRYGTLAVTSIRDRSLIHTLRAHTAEVSALITFERQSTHFLVSGSRDRTVQLFSCKGGKLELLQTLEEHAGAITGLLFSGSQLLSCSADRSVVVREAVVRRDEQPESLAFVMLRVLSLKSAPTSMCFTGQSDTVLISTVDRCVGKYSTKSGHAGFSFKCTDSEGGEAVVLSKILYAPDLNGNPTIAGVSTSDKSIRLYSEYGSLLGRDWGHTEGITDLALVEAANHHNSGRGRRSAQVVTVAADSTIFMWTSASHFSGADKSKTAASTPLGPPLRKVLSHSEISRIRRDRSTDDRGTPSTPTRPKSPQKLRKKASKISLTNTPKPDRAAFDPSCRRTRTAQRSPSPAVTKRDGARSKLGMTLRSKSTDNVLNTSGNSSQTGFGTLTASTESVCRTLRSYRKRLANAPTSSGVTTDSLRELEKELNLTARVVNNKSSNHTLDEGIVARLIDQASDRLAGLLDEKIKARVEDGLRRNSGLSSPTFSQFDTSSGSSMPRCEPEIRIETTQGAQHHA